MIAGVADTHALWFLYGDHRLSTVAKDFIEKAATDRHKIVLTPISLAAHAATAWRTAQEPA
jgi:hypothetical protein